MSERERGSSGSGDSGRRRRRQALAAHQLTWCDVTMPIRSDEAASPVVGEFFELLTAAMVRGHRRAVFGRAGDNPDVVNGAGRVYESKASGRGRWLLEATQCHQLEQQPNACYVCWSYTQPAPGGLKQHGTAGALRTWLAANITGCYVLPATYPRLILAETPHAAPRESQKAGRYWGCNYWFRARYLQEVLAGERRIAARFSRRTWPCQLRPIGGQVVSPFTVTRLFDIRVSGTTQGECPRCGRRRQPPCEIPTAHELALARVGLHELVTQRREILLVPMNDGSRRKRRIVAAVTPRWYRTLWDRRNPDGLVPRRFGSKRKPGQRAYQSIRGYVQGALASILRGCIRTHPQSMDREILEVLSEYDVTAEAMA